jgi:hypothetical protein
MRVLEDSSSLGGHSRAVSIPEGRLKLYASPGVVSERVVFVDESLEIQ